MTAEENKKLLEWQKCVLWLASQGGWHRPYELERKEVNNQMIGSEADTRLNELFGELPTRGEVDLDIDGAKYTLETKKEGSARLYRAYLKAEKPKPAPIFVIINGTRVPVSEL